MLDCCNGVFSFLKRDTEKYTIMSNEIKINQIVPDSCGNSPLLTSKLSQKKCRIQIHKSSESLQDM